MVGLAARADVIGDCASAAGALPQVVAFEECLRQVGRVAPAPCRAQSVPGPDLALAGLVQRQRVDRTTPPMMKAKPMSKFQFPIALITGMLPLVM